MNHEGTQAAVSDTAELLLSVRNLSKKFCRSLKRSLLYAVRDITSEMLAIRRERDQLRLGEFWALRDVTCQLRRGEALGLVGANGAGKSTLLRLVSGLIKPDVGEIRVRGKVAPLIALGAGFNPVLTGIENVYANMSILGLTKSEIDKRLESVLDFAEIDKEALSAPLRTYSSGMAARLGFACAINTDPNVLLIDEVLAVGDVKFRMKCYRQLFRLREKGTSFVLVSHNPHAILSICTSAVYLSEGRLLAAGSSNDVMRRYERDLFAGSVVTESANALVLPTKTAAESSGLDIRWLGFQDKGGRTLGTLLSGEPLTFCVSINARSEFGDVNLTLFVREQVGEGEWILRLSTIDDESSWHVPPGEYELQVELPYLSLRPGRYIMKLSVTRGALYMLDAVESFTFDVAGTSMVNCLFHQPHSWNIVSREIVSTS